MLDLFWSASDLNLVLAGLESNWSYQQGCLAGSLKLPLGRVELMAIPDCTSGWVVFSIPLSGVRGGLVVGLAKLVWGAVQQQVERRLVSALGWPPEAVVLDRFEASDEKFGRLAFSLAHLNGWFQRQHCPTSRLVPSLTGLDFREDGIQLQIRLEEARPTRE